MSDYQDLIEMQLVSARAGSSGWYRVDCPFCVDRTGKPDRKGSLAVSATTGRFSCWKCAEKGRIDIQYSGDIDYEEVPEVEQVEPPEFYEPLWKEPGLSAISLKPARRYLKKRLGERARGLCEAVGIGACAAGKQSGRIIVPVLDHTRRKWAGWVGRDWTGKAKRKYMYPSGMRRVLFNNAVLHERQEFVMVVEGVFDALPYWPNVVACLGKPSKDQFSMLLASVSPVVVALDGDAWQEGWALSRRLRFAGKEAGFVKLPPGSDPGSVDQDWLLGEAAASLYD